MAGRSFDAQTLGATPRGRADGVEARAMWVGDQKLMVAIKHGASTRPPLLLFNGIGANWELAEPFLEALTDTTAIIFDLPGVGDSPLPALPYRPSGIARLSAQLVSLERRCVRGGRDSIDHPPGGHDDVCNSAAGVLVQVAGEMDEIEVWIRCGRD